MILRKYIKALLEDLQRFPANVQSSIYTRIKLWKRTLEYRGYSIEVKFDAPYFLSVLFLSLKTEGWERAVQEATRSSEEVGLDKYFSLWEEDEREQTITFMIESDKLDITGDNIPDFDQIGLEDRVF